jgi:hypothetical protein
VIVRLRGLITYDGSTVGIGRQPPRDAYWRVRGMLVAIVTHYGDLREVSGKENCRFRY